MARDPLAVRARPEALLEFTTCLSSFGFLPDGESWRGHQQRWAMDGTVLDLKGYRRLRAALMLIADDPSFISSIGGGREGLQRVAVAMTGSRLCNTVGGSEPPPPFV